MELRFTTNMSNQFFSSAQPMFNFTNQELDQPQEDTFISESFKLSLNSKKIQKKRFKYQRIDDTLRQKLIDAITEEGQMLKAAAKRFKINYSSAKSIFHTFKKEGRVCKKAVRQRHSKKPKNTSQERTEQSNLTNFSSAQTTESSPKVTSSIFTKQNSFTSSSHRITTLNPSLYSFSAEPSLEQQLPTLLANQNLMLKDSMLGGFNSPAFFDQGKLYQQFSNQNNLTYQLFLQNLAQQAENNLYTTMFGNPQLLAPNPQSKASLFSAFNLPTVMPFSNQLYNGIHPFNGTNL